MILSSQPRNSLADALHGRGMRGVRGMGVTAVPLLNSALPITLSDMVAAAPLNIPNALATNAPTSASTYPAISPLIVSPAPPSVLQTLTPASPPAQILTQPQQAQLQQQLSAPPSAPANTVPAADAAAQPGVMSTSTVTSGSCQYQVAGITPDPGIPFCSGLRSSPATPAQIAAIKAAQAGGGYTDVSTGAFYNGGSSTPSTVAAVGSQQAAAIAAGTNAPTDTTTELSDGATKLRQQTPPRDYWTVGFSLLLIGGAALLLFLFAGKK